MKKAKRIAGIVLAFVLAFSMTVTTSFAGTSSLTIANPADGHTYEVYQLLVGDVAADLSDGAGTVSNIKAGKNFKATNASNKDAEAVQFAKDMVGKSGTEVSKLAITKYEGTAVNTLSTTKTSIDVADGYYLVIDKDGSTPEAERLGNAYMVAVVGDTVMNPKSSKPSIDKNIVDTDSNKAKDYADNKGGKVDTAAIGDVINYEITGTVPVTEGYKYYYYVVNDTLSKGLTLNDGIKVKIGNKTLDEGNGTDGYVVTTKKNTDGTTSLKIVVNDMKQFTAGDAIVISYKATVNKDAEVGTTANTNTVNLTYSNNPSDTFNKDKNPGNEPGTGDVTGTTPNVVTKTYVTQVTIQKTDATENAFVDALKGATFKLSGTGLNDVVVTTETVFTKATDGTYYKLKDGTYTTTAPVAEGDNKNIDKYESTTDKYATGTVVSVSDADSGSECNITAVVDANGQILFKGLNAGTYKLVETNVPDGYNKAADMEFEIKATYSETTKDIAWSIADGAKNITLTEANGVFSSTIVNEKGTVLPSTGGIGTTIFYILGAILVLGAGVVLVSRRRVSRG